MPHERSPASPTPDDEFDRLWVVGEPPDVAAFLSGHPTVSLASRVDVLRVDQVRRWARGERVRAEEYFARFPEVAADPESALLLVFGEMLLDPRGVTGTLTEARSRFPHLAELLDLQVQLDAELADAESTRPQASGPTPAPSLPGYEVLGQLGQGGMGTVYRARHLALGREVALKVLRDAAAGGELVSRLRREAGALARLSHPHIVQVHALDDIEGQPCLVMELVSGGSLEEKLGRQRLSAVDSARLIAIVARAVQAAHAKGIVHRDLKPGNVLMADPVEGSSENILGGFPKVSDFGLARLAGDDQKQSGTGQVLGTPHYMAPEQAEGRTADIGPPCDVWSLGVMLYRCLSGRVPFDGRYAVETLNRVISDEPASFAELGVEVPAALGSACMRCLEKQPSQRPVVGELASELEQFVQAAGSEGVAIDRGVQRAPQPGVAGNAAGAIPRRRASRPLNLALGLGAATAVLAAVASGAVLVGKYGRADSVEQGGDKGTEVASAGRLVKALRVKRWQVDPERPWAEMGNESSVAAFADDVKIEVEFAEPAYAYLIGFNPDGKEQLLLPVTERMEWRTDATAKPEAARLLEFPHPERANFRKDGKPAVWILNDEEGGGTQVFVVVASRKPLPPYEVWKQEGRGPVAWSREPSCNGVYGYRNGKLTTISAGKHELDERGNEGGQKGVPALADLCRALKKGGVEVEAIAFMVQAKAKE